MSPWQYRLGVGLMMGLAGTVWGGRPLVVNDTEPVGVGEIQIEGSGLYRNDRACRHYEYPFTLASGLCPGVDLGVGMGGQIEERFETAGDPAHETGLCDLVVFPRWKFLDEAGSRPSQAVSLVVKFPTADRDKDLGSGATDYDLIWIASKRLGEKTQIDANFGYAWIGDPDEETEPMHDLIHYGVAASHEFIPGWQGVAELFAQRDMAQGAETVVQYDAGVRWQALDGLMFDVAAGSVLSGEGPDFTFTAGFTWVWGAGGDPVPKGS